MSESKSPIEACQATRRKAQVILEDVMPQAVGHTEAELHRQIVNRMAQEDDWLPGGWYSPPPDGVSVLFGRPPDFSRIEFDSLRPPENWPKAESPMQPGDAVSAYLSPVHESGIIGDIGLVAYPGADERLRSHLQASLRTAQEMIDLAEVGMSFKELVQASLALAKEHGLHTATITMVTKDDDSNTNLGHTIPWTDVPITAEERKTLTAEIGQRNDLISKSRVMVDATEDFVIPETVAFTIEPRLKSINDADLPLGWYHHVVTFTEGRKEVLGGFNGIFKAMGMDYLESKY